MYLCIDVGGTKTLVATLDDNGAIQEKYRFETPASYDDFLNELASNVAKLSTKEFHAAGIGIPATRIDRAEGVGLQFGNLPLWKNVPILTDVEKLAHCPVVVENDAKLAGLSEAMLLKGTYKKVLYVTISTGIGTALIKDCIIDTSLGDGGGKTILLEHRGKLTPWENFASGKALFERFGKQAQDITDESTWKEIVHNLAVGFIDLIAFTQPDIIVVGGSVGRYFERYESLLGQELAKYETPLNPIPPIVEAQRPEEAVLYGCYDLAKVTYGSTTKTA